MRVGSSRLREWETFSFIATCLKLRCALTSRNSWNKYMLYAEVHDLVDIPKQVVGYCMTMANKKY